MKNLVIAALLLSEVAGAATLQQLSLDQMTQSATAIVRARITGSYASRVGPAIYTHYKLQVTESWKGFPTAEVMLPGGVADGLKQSVPGVPQLPIGSEYIMFLWTSPSTGITHLVGLTQGIFNITKQTDGSVVAARNQIAETMLDASGSKVADHAIRMDLADMKAQVATTGVRAAARQTSGPVQ